MMNNKSKNSNGNLIIGTHNGRDVFFNIHEAENKNLLITGTSGSGKSTKVVKTQIELAKAGATVVAFDTHNVLADNQIYDGLKQDFYNLAVEIDAYNEGIPLPMFTPIKFEDGEIEKDIDVVDSITDVISRTFKLGVKQKAVFRIAVEEVYSRNEYTATGIAAIAEALNAMDTPKSYEVMEKTRPLTGHNLFYDGHLSFIPGRINIIRLSKFSEDLQSIITEIMLAFLWRAASKEGLNTEMYLSLDECQNFNLSSGGMISRILSEGRKFNLNLILSTQVMPQKQEIKSKMTQAGLAIYFKPASSQNTTIAGYISRHNAEAWSGKLAKLECGQFIACGQMIYNGRSINEPLIVSDIIPDINEEGGEPAEIYSVSKSI